MVVWNFLWKKTDVFFFIGNRILDIRATILCYLYPLFFMLVGILIPEVSIFLKLVIMLVRELVVFQISLALSFSHIPIYVKEVS